MALHQMFSYRILQTIKLFINVCSSNYIIYYIKKQQEIVHR